MSTLPDSQRSLAPQPAPTCFMQNYLYIIDNIRRSPTTGSPVGTQTQNQNGGLDPLIIESFPTFTYSSVKEFRRDTYGLECSICLLEFEDVDVLRLMTVCCHVFHQECIDLWLVSHKTCPACRRALDHPLPKESSDHPQYSPLPTNNSLMHESINGDDELSMPGSYTITIKDDNDVQYQDEKAKALAHAYDTPILGRKFSRSNTTRHSIVNMEMTTPTYVEEDKFTLKLPDHVKSKIFRGHHWSQSCTTFGEYKSKSRSGSGGFRELDNRPNTSNGVP